jgi:F0F1-type ATP synthase assembly protein I
MIGQLTDNHQGTRLSIIGMTIFVIIGFIMLFFVKNDLRRIKLQKEQEMAEGAHVPLNYSETKMSQSQ